MTTDKVSDAYFGFTPCFNCLSGNNLLPTEPITAAYQLKIGTNDNKATELWVNGVKVAQNDTMDILSKTQATTILFLRSKEAFK